MDINIGDKICMLTIIDYAEDYIAPSGGVHKVFMCRCDCGKIVKVLKEYITSGRQKSCGCLRKKNGVKKHGMIKTRLYHIWGNMVNRCTNENNPAYHNYGGRGIFVCEEWKDFSNFMKWACENGYNETLTIDRINNDDGYYPDNCRWADIITQANNKRSNVYIEYDGQTYTMMEWSKIIGIPYKTLHNRITSNKWRIERAFNEPLRMRDASNEKVS